MGREKLKKLNALMLQNTLIRGNEQSGRKSCKLNINRRRRESVKPPRDLPLALVACENRLVMFFQPFIIFQIPRKK